MLALLSLVALTSATSLNTDTTSSRLAKCEEPFKEFLRDLHRGNTENPLVDNLGSIFPSDLCAEIMLMATELAASEGTTGIASEGVGSRGMQGRPRRAIPRESPGFLTRLISRISREISKMRMSNPPPFSCTI